MKNKKYLLLTFLSISTILNAVPKDINATQSKDWYFLPYVFSSDTTGFAGGISALKEGLFQPQTTFVATVFAGASKDVIINGEEDKSNFLGGFISFSDYKLPYSDRLFFSFMGFKSHIPKRYEYVDGSNSSDKNAAYTSSGDSNFFNTIFRYTLPLGDGIDNPSGIYKLENGFCVGREDCGNGIPFITGRTSIGIKTFYETKNTDDTELWQDPIWWENGTSKPTWNTNGLRFFLTHDNTDFEINPSRGYQFQLQYSKDFGWEDSLQSWDFLEFGYNHYFDLGKFPFTLQNILALNVWTGYSFSWDVGNNITEEGFDAHQPPMWEGGRLGGFMRMRGYDQNRFSGKAVFYASAEYRSIIDYNPLKNNKYLPVDIEWFQVVPFVEAGKVNDEYNLDLLNDMKFDAGISLRAMISEFVVRFDVAYGEEGTYIWLMQSHPFDFTNF